MDKDNFGVIFLVARDVCVCAVIVDGFKIFGADRKPGNILIFF
jgi:hypothetical protein